MCGSVFSGEADGVAGIDGVVGFEGICIPGVCMCGSIFSGEADGVAGVDGVVGFDGVSIPGMVIPGMLMSCFLTERFRRVIGLLRRELVFRFSFGFGLLMPGMLWPSCCANAIGVIPSEINIAATRNKYLEREIVLLITSPMLGGAGVLKNDEKRPRLPMPNYDFGCSF
jgi:hypothetical protein